MVKFKKSLLPDTYISLCGRYTIKPASMVTGQQHHGGFYLNDLKTGGRLWGADPKPLKRYANDIPSGKGLTPVLGADWFALVDLK